MAAVHLHVNVSLTIVENIVRTLEPNVVKNGNTLMRAMQIFMVHLAKVCSINYVFQVWTFSIDISLFIQLVIATKMEQNLATKKLASVYANHFIMKERNFSYNLIKSAPSVQNHSMAPTLIAKVF